MTSHSKTTKACVLISGAALLLLASWISMSSVNYSSTESHFPLLTAGWFILGLIFLFPISLGFAGIFLLLSRWLGLRVAWFSMLLIGLVLVGLAVWSALPINRLKPLIGDKAAAAASIERLCIRDSFNDGEFYAGVLSGGTNLMPLIEDFRPLQRRKVQMPLIQFRGIFRDVALPDEGEEYGDDHGSFFADADGKSVYFWHTSRGSCRRNGEQSPSGDVLKAAPEE